MLKASPQAIGLSDVDSVTEIESVQTGRFRSAGERKFRRVETNHPVFAPGELNRKPHSHKATTAVCNTEHTPRISYLLDPVRRQIDGYGATYPRSLLGKFRVAAKSPIDQSGFQLSLPMGTSS